MIRKNITLLVSAFLPLNFFTLSDAISATSESMKQVSVQPESFIRSDYQIGEVIDLCRKAMDRAKTQFDKVASLPVSERTFENTLLAFEAANASLSDAVLPLTFMGYVSRNTDTHAEGSKCEEEYGKFNVEMITRKDLYLALKNQVPRNDQEKRLHTETLKGFESNGLNLGEAELAQVKELKQKLSTLESQFSTHLNNDDSQIEVTREELAGLPADYSADLKKTPDGARFIIKTRSSDYEMVLNNASLESVRRKWLLAYFNRQGKENTQLLEEAILLRQQIAKLMGYSTWADYRIHGRMATDAKTVLKFLNDLKEKLSIRNREDIAKLLKFKQENDRSATEVKNWDINYLSYQLKKRDYSLDEEKIREYFPADRVISGIFEIYSNILGVRYIEEKDVSVWSPDVKFYRIEDRKDNHLIGYFYADFFPRSAKYGHAAAFPLISGRVLNHGSYSAPIAAIVSNFSPPSNGKPSLLSHGDVVTLFHEFGHIMHQTLTRAPYASLSGTNVAQDFVEAPSQMLENWSWDLEVLKNLSGHYLNPQEKLPSDLLNKMVAARDFNQGYYYTRQLTLALLDMTYHTTTGPVDATAIYDGIFKEMIGVNPIEGGHFPASFGHLMGGYDAGYYGYLWSEVYAADMFTRFDAEGLLNPEVGTQYRQIVLEKGNSRDAIDLLREFLGREPNTKAFFKKLNIK